MLDYIDRELAKEEILSWARLMNKPHLLSLDDTMCVLDSLPVVDVVAVVRCGECARRVKSADLSNTVLCAWLHNLEMPKDGFCSYGERSG